MGIGRDLSRYTASSLMVSARISDEQWECDMASHPPGGCTNYRGRGGCLGFID
jgi:hypothetical protein